jgi:hypothetical protein
MNETPKSPRNTQEIQAEYQTLCMKAGDLSYKIECSQKDLKALYESLRNLNLEYVQASQLEAKVAEQVAAAQAKEAAPKLEEVKNA